MGSSKEGGEEEQTLKEGEKIVAPTRRPDGTLRKPIRIRAGYVPQDEVAIYQSKGSLWKKGREAVSLVPPGFDPVADAKSNTKSAKRNERKKEKRQQTALEKNTNYGMVDGEEVIPIGGACPANECARSLTSQMNHLAVSETLRKADRAVSIEDLDAVEAADSGSSLSLVDKKIRALKKKIRQAGAQLHKVTPQEMNPEQLDKLAKLEAWRQELKLLECGSAENASS